MRRLSILRRFAKRLGLEFDIENMEISLLTKPKTKDENKSKDPEEVEKETDMENEFIMKQQNFEEIANFI